VFVNTFCNQISLNQLGIETRLQWNTYRKWHMRIKWSRDPWLHAFRYRLTALHAPGRGCDRINFIVKHTALFPQQSLTPTSFLIWCSINHLLTYLLTYLLTSGHLLQSCLCQYWTGS